MSNEDRNRGRRLGYQPTVAIDEVGASRRQWRDQGGEPPGLRTDVGVEHYDIPILICETGQGGEYIGAFLTAAVRHAGDDDIDRRLAMNLG